MRTRRLPAWLLFPSQPSPNPGRSKTLTRPSAWGTPPTEVAWAKPGHTLSFLWNAEGNRVHGIVHNNVMFQDAVALTGKLAQESKNFPEVYYLAKSHSFVRGEALIDSFRRSGEWLDRYLK